MDTRERIRRFIVENFYVRNAAELADDDLLVNGGIIDSTGMLEVISFLEGAFGIRIADTDTTPENLESIDRMVQFVDRKRRSAA